MSTNAERNEDKTDPETYQDLGQQPCEATEPMDPESVSGCLAVQVAVFGRDARSGATCELSTSCTMGVDDNGEVTDDCFRATAKNGKVASTYDYKIQPELIGVWDDDQFEPSSDGRRGIIVELPNPRPNGLS